MPVEAATATPLTWKDRTVTAREALRICRQREHLRRTIWIALVVGTILTLINQLDVILRGDATSITWVKAALNYLA
jgi:hypothetical protein